ncbi:MAG: glyoxalase/bleomycin resistance/dioxygenase family protein [Armatimonadetes bacterium]|nr:MAG: glyoxalase/bleomycin resistance/dioxygenase family protein [Armatimonadota bacterium]
MANTAQATPTTGRIQLALNVEDLEASTRFYSELFGTAPVKERDGYVNFAIAEPPLKLILFQGGEGGTINHLGVEVPSSDGVKAAISRLELTGMELDVEDEVTCCYATQDKVWATAPDGERWEYYTVLSDAEQMESDSCCETSSADAEPVKAACC